MVEFEGVELLLQKGDKIKSKKGILLVKSPMSGKDFIVYGLEYLGEGKFCSFNFFLISKFII